VLTKLGVVVAVPVPVVVVVGAVFEERGCVVAVVELQTSRAFVGGVGFAAVAAVAAVVAVAVVAAVAAVFLLCGPARSELVARCCPRTSRFVVLPEETSLVLLVLLLLLLCRARLVVLFWCFH